MRSPIKLLKRRRTNRRYSSGIILIVAITIIANYTVEHKTDTLIYKDAATIPAIKRAFIGTSKPSVQVLQSVLSKQDTGCCCSF